jgi:type II secretory pathway component GspD/PulD (secretin)
MKRLAVCYLFISLLLPALAQEFQTKVFVLNARPAEATVEMVKPLLSPGGRVVPDTRLNKLVVRDTPAVLADIEALLTEIDQHMPQVRITVQMNGVSQNSGGEAGIAIAGNNRRAVVSGTAVAGHSSSQIQSQQNLLVMSGERGVIHVARNVVNYNPYRQFAVNAGLLSPDFLVQTVGTGFAVEPVVVGDVVRLRITPWMSFVGASGGNEIRVDEASSTFAVPSGQSVMVSSAGYNEEIRNRAFGLVLGGNNLSTQGSSSIVLTPVIQDY